MARLVVSVLVLLVAGASAGSDERNDVIKPVLASKVLAQRQHDLTVLYLHIHEPNPLEACQLISNTWSFEKNVENFKNVSAVRTYMKMLEHEWVLPKGVPFSISEMLHKFEAVTLFNVLYSAKDYDSFYKAAVFLRERVNEYLFVYVLSVAILNRADTQGIRIPPIYEILPSMFNNAEIMLEAQRVNTHGFNMIHYYPKTYKWDDSVIIKWNETIWPYYNSESTPVAYFTHDYDLNAFYYYLNLANPSWLGGDIVPLVKDRRGEWFWFMHKQIVSRYYMERLSNGLGEIPQLGQEIVKQGYSSGLMYQSGVTYPVRPNYFKLNQPEFLDELQEINDYERRIRDAIERGYAIDSTGNHISLRTVESIDVLGRMIEANVDSPNSQFYKNFISIWKHILGNPVIHEHFYHNDVIPLVVPSVLENYQTAMRDPAFYMIWKRVLGLFELWQQNLPHYKLEELALPSVSIEKVDVDKLMTFFEYSYMNITQELPRNELEVAGFFDQVNVMVQRPRLNHKKFQVRVHVKSQVEKNVIVRLFLAPKYDSHGHEIPLDLNTQNFYMLDEFPYVLSQGESVITRDSDDYSIVTKELPSCMQLLESSYKAVHDQGQLVVDMPENLLKLPHHLLLPKGRVGGMPFVLMVHITEHRQPKISGTDYDKFMSLGLGSGARFHSGDPLGFPFNRPLYLWQIKDLKNLVLQDVQIYHKHTPEVHVPHME